MIGFAGLSHLGIVSAIAAASKGLDVVGYDADLELCRSLSEARLPVVEPGLSELLAVSRARIAFTNRLEALSRCQLIYVSLDVPTSADHRGDESGIERLAMQVIENAPDGATVVVLCQVRPGFTRRLWRRMEAADRRLTLHYQVETLIFGRAVERALRPERFIIGCADSRCVPARALSDYLETFGCPVLPMRYESAELCKISINMFLVASVATTNMLAELCEAVGARWQEIAPALRLDQRIGPHAYLNAGLGIGGGNLTRDLATVSVLSSEHGTDASLVGCWQRDSEYRRDWVLRQLHRHVIGAVDSPAIAVWGLAYKENTHSIKNSPAVHLLGALAAGGVQTRAWDPAAEIGDEMRVRFGVGDSPVGICDGADALVVITPWPEFAEVDLDACRRRMRGHLLLDPFGRLEAERARRSGFHYLQIGRSVS